MKLILHLLILLLLAACGSLRNEVSPSLLSTEGEKLVVNSYISPQDTLLSVKVSRSKPVLGEQTDALPYTVDNAIVSLTDGNRVVVLRYLSDKQWYQAKANLLPIVTGKTYTLTVSTPDGKQVTASAIVPKPVPVNQGILDSTIVTLGNRLQKIYSVRFDWQDPPNEPNFYEYAAYFRWGYNNDPYGQVNQQSNSLRSLSFARENRTGNLLTDDRQDGTLLTSLAAEVGLVEVNATTPNAVEALKKLTMGRVLPNPQVILRLLSAEELYYRYTDAIIRQRENRSNPFAEPVLIPTNIKGGLGCFAAYNRTEKVFPLR
ncbi:DUF4249 domain-containing protein [Fibrella forsythiae]|uniref:DUF4249 domain-containing protein n=1 Tax=Fibrella forsythiae TaxID=2817061 RepID=A0ABS3JRT2_9BACT|nr:DUF4249 domain-containing protein [Fibrella forsythiae]MBO0952728.1 DUF4249 domain-containing protein [Fibrella forsythiae]